MARKNKPKPSAGSVPTYIRFTSDQLIAMDEAVKKGSFLVRNGHPQTRMPHRVTAVIIYRRHGVRSRPLHH